MKIELAEREGYVRVDREKVAAILKNIRNITFDDVPLGGRKKILLSKFSGAKTGARPFGYAVSGWTLSAALRVAESFII